MNALRTLPDAEWDAAELDAWAAAWLAAWEAAEAAAWNLTWIATEAAFVASGVKGVKNAGAAARSTVERLQANTQDFVRRLCAVTEAPRASNGGPNG